MSMEEFLAMSCELCTVGFLGSDGIPFPKVD